MTPIMRDYGRELHSFVYQLAPNFPVKLYDRDGNKILDGYAHEITDSIKFYKRRIYGYYYNNHNHEMIIWTLTGEKTK